MENPTLMSRVKRAQWQFVLALLLMIVFGLWQSRGHEIAPENLPDNPPLDRLSVIAAIPQNFPPQYTLDVDSKPTGFAIDVMDLVAKQANLDVRYQVFDGWDTVFEAVRSGRADLIPNCGITPKRQKEFAFTPPVETFPVVLVVRQSEQKIHNQSDLVGHTVITEITNVAVDLLQHRPSVDLKLVNTMEEALFHLLAGEVDVLAGPEPVIRSMAHSIGVQDRIKVIGQPLIEVKRAIAIRKDNADLLARLEPAVQDVVHSAKYRRIYTQWYGVPNPYLRLVWFLLGALLLLFFVLFILHQLNRKLELRVQERTTALQHSKESYQQLAEDMPALICKFLPDSTLTYVNTDYCRYFNRHPDQLLGSRFLDLLPNEATRQANQANYMALTPDRPFAISEHPVVCADGSARWQQWVNRAFFDKHGRITSLQAIGLDISDRKQAEAERDRLLQALSQLNANLEQANRQLEEYSQTLEQKVEARTQELSQALADLQATQQELIHSEKMAALGQLTASVAHEINTPLGVIRAATTNITAAFAASLHQLPPLLQRLSAQQQTDFLALVDTALRQPSLSTQAERQLRRHWQTHLEAQGIAKAVPIATQLTLLRLAIDDDSYRSLLADADATTILETAYNLVLQHQNASSIQQEIDRAAKIVFALKTYSYQNSTGERSLFVVTEGIEVALTLYQNRLKQGIEVIRQYDSPLPLILGNPDELTQVWVNLIDNALYAMGQQGILQIRVAHQSDWVTVEITDSGCGIPAEVRSRIFEPFFTTKPRGEGSGLGLDIVRQIAQKHGGDIQVQSQPGRTTFTLQLPLKNEK